MPSADTDQKRKNVILICISLALIILIAAAFIVSQQQAASQNASESQVLEDQETAYENILKDCLRAHYSRYQSYPADYQALLKDIEATPDIYGVNQEGLADLKAIDQRLTNFSYGTIGATDYLISYKKAATGKTATIIN